MLRGTGTPSFGASVVAGADYTRLGRVKNIARLDVLPQNCASEAIGPLGPKFLPAPIVGRGDVFAIVFYRRPLERVGALGGVLRA